MNMLGCLDAPDAGSYLLDGKNVADIPETVLAGIRNRRIGFIFQSFNLIPSLTALENVELPLIYRRIPRRERLRLAQEALERVGIANRMRTTPPNCRAASSSAPQSPGRSQPNRRLFWRMNRPATSIRRRARK